MSIMLNFWSVICKNEKFMNFFAKIHFFFCFLTFSNFFKLSILISDKMTNENC